MDEIIHVFGKAVDIFNLWSDYPALFYTMLISIIVPGITIRYLDEKGVITKKQTIIFEGIAATCALILIVMVFIRTVLR